MQGGLRGLLGVDGSHLLAAARYVELNPVRAGLVIAARDYRWSSARAHLRGKDDCLVRVSPLLAIAGNWRRLLAGAVSEEQLDEFRQHERTGRVLGDDKFQKRPEKKRGRILRRQKPGPKTGSKASASKSGRKPVGCGNFWQIGRGLLGVLTEGWDANNVVHILGIRAFGSQLLCEQVVGRGLRRMNYDPDPETGLLPEEYADVYGIPFSVIPFKGRPVNKETPEDRPKHRVCAVLDHEDEMEMRFPIVEGYVFALARNLLKCNVTELDPLSVDPRLEPTTTFLRPTAGYLDTQWNSVPFEFVQQDRDEYYRQTHL